MRMTFPFSSTRRGVGMFTWLAIIFVLSIILITGIFLYQAYATGNIPKENLLVAGSTTIRLFIVALAEDFSIQNPDVAVVTAGGGSTAGLIAVKKNAIDIAGTSRDLTGLEDDEFTRSYLIARDGMAVVVHKANPIDNLTLEQVREVFTGKTTNWNALGGPDAPINICIRDEESTTRSGFEETVMRGEDYIPSAKIFTGHQGLGYAVSRDPFAISYFRGHWLENEPGIKAIKIDGVAYERMKILTGLYPLTRSFYFVFNGEPKGLAKRFLDFALSKKGQKIMEDQGTIRVY